MTDFQWKAFCQFRDEYRIRVTEWNTAIGAELLPLQKKAADEDKTPEYPVETPVVYNHTLDDVTPLDEIRLIVIGDNPGKNEQLAKNQRYLVGQAGKLADGFFRRNPELGIDFRKNVIILNKTPLHTAKTKQLTSVLKNGSLKVRQIFEESQKWCAKNTALLHRCLNTDSNNYCNGTKKTCGLWLVGYGELTAKGLFTIYRETLADEYRPLPDSDSAKNSLLVFQHFSMNRFSIDLRDFTQKLAMPDAEYSKKTESNQQQPSLSEIIRELGLLHRRAILGF